MSETLVTIGRYLDPTEAHIAAGLLRSEGIPVYPLDTEHSSENLLPGVGSGGFRLQVPASFEQEAPRLLANRESSDEAESTDLATRELSKPERAESGPLLFGMLSIRDRLRHKDFWLNFPLFDIAFVALVLLAIWATS